MTELQEGDFVVPGDCVGPSTRHSPGKGVYNRGNTFYASLCGRITLKSESSGTHIVSVESCCRSVVVPEKGSVVLCKVVSVTQSYAKVLILSVNNLPLLEHLKGIIRKEEIRSTEKDTVNVFMSYHPRDIVRARVLSLGESQLYTLSTAENELGVIFATSEQNGQMIPINWSEMQCTLTGVKERRKVAKVINAVPIN